MTSPFENFWEMSTDAMEFFYSSVIESGVSGFDLLTEEGNDLDGLSVYLIVLEHNILPHLLEVHSFKPPHMQLRSAAQN